MVLCMPLAPFAVMRCTKASVLETGTHSVLDDKEQNVTLNTNRIVFAEA